MLWKWDSWTFLHLANTNIFLFSIKCLILVFSLITYSVWRCANELTSGFLISRQHAKKSWRIWGLKSNSFGEGLSANPFSIFSLIIIKILDAAVLYTLTLSNIHRTSAYKTVAHFDFFFLFNLNIFKFISIITFWLQNGPSTLIPHIP